MSLLDLDGGTNGFGMSRLRTTPKNVERMFYNYFNYSYYDAHYVNLFGGGSPILDRVAVHDASQFVLHMQTQFSFIQTVGRDYPLSDNPFALNRIWAETSDTVMGWDYVLQLRTHDDPTLHTESRTEAWNYRRYTFGNSSAFFMDCYNLSDIAFHNAYIHSTIGDTMAYYGPQLELCEKLLFAYISMMYVEQMFQIGIYGVSQESQKARFFRKGVRVAPSLLP